MHCAVEGGLVSKSQPLTTLHARPGGAFASSKVHAVEQLPGGGAITLFWRAAVSIDIPHAHAYIEVEGDCDGTSKSFSTDRAPPSQSHSRLEKPAGWPSNWHRVPLQALLE
jgi:hypothetical protein